MYQPDSLAVLVSGLGDVRVASSLGNLPIYLSDTPANGKTFDNRGRLFGFGGPREAVPAGCGYLILGEDRRVSEIFKFMDDPWPQS